MDPGQILGKLPNMHYIATFFQFSVYTFFLLTLDHMGSKILKISQFSSDLCQTL